MMWHMGDGWGWWMIYGLVFMIAFWVIIAWAIGSAGRRPPGDSAAPPRHGEPTALQILERRYANGDLTDEEFEEKRRRLLGTQREPYAGDS
jgi:putative membrane protein